MPDNSTVGPLSYLQLISADGTYFETIYMPMIKVPLWAGGEQLPYELRDLTAGVPPSISAWDEMAGITAGYDCP